MPAKLFDPARVIWLPTNQAWAVVIGPQDVFKCDVLAVKNEKAEAEDFLARLKGDR